MGYGLGDLRAVVFSIGWLVGGCQRVEPYVGPIKLSILSPAELEHVEGELTVVFHVDGNFDGATVAAAAGGPEDVYVTLAPGVSDGELLITPELGSGIQRLAFAAWSDVDITNYHAEYRRVIWQAPWEVRLHDCQVTDCPELAADATLATAMHLGALPRWDGNLLAGAEMTINGVPVDDLDPSLTGFKFDVANRPDGPVTLEATVIRDDGVRSTVTRQIDVANCALAKPDEQYSSAAYTTDGLMFTAGSVLTRRDLRDRTVKVSTDYGDLLSPLAVDEANQRIYVGLQRPVAPSLFFSTLDKPELGYVDPAAQVLGLTGGADGEAYWTVGIRGSTPAGQIFHSSSTGYAVRVDVGGIPGADGLLFDDDGTLLVTAGASIVRLTLTAGVETARTTVLTRAGATLTQLALDDQHRLYVVDKAAGELLRYTDVAAAPEVLYTQLDWASKEPRSMTFVQYPPLCHGLLITRQGLADARRMVDVGPVRGRP